MKKKSGGRIAKLLSRIFNVRRWFDWDRMKAFTLFVGHGYRRVFEFTEDDKNNPSQEALTTSFSQATKQQQLTDADLLQRQKALLRLSFFMLTLAVLIFIYSVYHFIHLAIFAGFLSLIVTMVALSIAFRYHFWYYQIKNRKLGCTAQEWFKKGLLGEKND
jgi:intracellular multiplication protein IcmV